MSRHLNIPIFIPHLGCPHTCVFCNQRSISGAQSFDRESVDAQIREALVTTCEGDTAEIAYFGGSFTGIDHDLMTYLLDVAERYVQAPLRGAARVRGIRMSTNRTTYPPRSFRFCHATASERWSLVCRAWMTPCLQHPDAGTAPRAQSRPAACFWRRDTTWWDK